MKYQTEYEPILDAIEIEQEDEATSSGHCLTNWKSIAALIVVLVLTVMCFTAIGLYLGRYAPPPTQTGRFRILFFSDFYRIEGVPLFPADQDNQLGGVARLATLVKQQKAELPCLVVFGGDMFSPSGMSSFFGKPDQMVETMNTLNLTVALAGNHEFDKGLEFAVSQFPRFTFPWVLGNLYLQNTTTLIPGLSATFVTEIGFFGVGYDYRTSTDMKNVEYEDRLDAAYRLANYLRNTTKVDLVICLAHVPFADGPLLVKRAPEIDLVLMGHNHFWNYRRENDVNIIEGDVNLEKLSVIDISFLRRDKAILREEKVTFIIPDNTTPKDPSMELIVEKFERLLEKEFGQVIGSTSVTLDCRNNAVRSRETNVGNLVADAMRNWSIGVYTDSPFHYIALMNGGGLRWNREIPPRNLTKGDVVELLPFGNINVVFFMMYDDLRAVLEQGLAYLPEPDGSFFQISGFHLYHKCRLDDSALTNSSKRGAPNEPLPLYRQYYNSARNSYDPPPHSRSSLVACDAPIGSRIRNLTYYNGTEISPEQKFIVAVPGYYLGDPLFSHLTLLVDEEAGIGDVELLMTVIQAQSPLAPVTSGRIVPLT